MCKFQNVPCALGSEIKHSKFFCKVSGMYNIITIKFKLLKKFN